MYFVQTTPGFIVQSQPVGEAGKILSIFTSDFGLVKVSAKGIRLEKSKLRYLSQDYRLGIFSLIRGREFWRLTSIGEVSSRIHEDRQRLVLRSRIAFLIRRFLHGEVPNPELFQCIKFGLDFLDQAEKISPDQIISLESLLVARILKSLGYIGDDPRLSDHFQSYEIDNTLLDHVSQHRIILNQHINKALEESHL